MTEGAFPLCPLIKNICGGNVPLDGIEWRLGPQVAAWGAHLRS